ncbi:MAG: YbaB/EbfC family nucleoid-associated protein [Proteobacteria bacterium]|nr:YbaB/EbfC family nucleoid-associated protein [Pseudomonadota bacterium]
MDMKSIMKQAQALQSEMAKKQEELSKRTFEASAGGGMVTAAVNGRHELIKLSIDPSVAGGSDVQMLEDLVTAAVNEAFKRSSEAMQSELSGMMGGLGGLGGMFG